MAKNNKPRRRSGFNTQKVFKYVRLAALVAPAAMIAVGGGSAQQKVASGLAQYTGFDIQTGTFDGTRLAKGWGPYVMSILTTYGIPKLAGIIRGI